MNRNLHVLRQLFGNLELESFLQQYWEKDYLIATEGRKASSINLLDIDTLLNGRAISSDDLKLVRKREILSKSEYVDSKGLPKSKEVHRLLNEGTTVIINGIDRFLPKIARMCKAIEQQFFARSGANCYITPRASEGFGIHFDCHNVFVIQIAGKKRWDLRGNATPNPMAYQKLASIALETPLQAQIELLEGDVLYIPRGHVHRAYTDDSFSVHISISAAPLTIGDVLHSLVRNAESLTADLRRSLISFGINSEAYPSCYVHQIRDVIAKSFQPQLPDFQDALEMSLREVRSIDIFTLEKLSRISEYPLTIQATDLFVLEKESNSVDVKVKMEGKEYRFPASFVPALEALASLKPVNVSRVFERFSQADQRRIVEFLLSESIVTVC